MQDKVSEELGTGKLTKAKRMKLETLLDELSQSLPGNSSFEKEYKHLLRFREYNKGYISRLLFDYAEGMELLEIFKEKILAIGNQFYQGNKKNKTYKFKVLTALYDRAVLVASEVITLMQNGFASGALSRWRTLYETSVIAIFLSINEEVSLLHVIEAYVLLKPSLDNLVNIWFLRKMVTDIANAFMRGQEKTQQEEIQYN